MKAISKPELLVELKALEVQLMRPLSENLFFLDGPAASGYRAQWPVRSRNTTGRLTDVECLLQLASMPSLPRTGPAAVDMSSYLSNSRYRLKTEGVMEEIEPPVISRQQAVELSDTDTDIRSSSDWLRKLICCEAYSHPATM